MAPGSFSRDEITAQTRMALMEDRLERLKEDVSEVKDELNDVKDTGVATRSDVSALRTEMASMRGVLDKLAATLETRQQSSFLTRGAQQTLGGILMAAVLYLLQHYGLAPAEAVAVQATKPTETTVEQH